MINIVTILFYSCHHFLKTCGNGSTLLYHAEQDVSTSGLPEATSVFRVLREYIQESGTLLLVR